MDGFHATRQRVKRFHIVSFAGRRCIGTGALVKYEEVFFAQRVKRGFLGGAFNYLTSSTKRADALERLHKEQVRELSAAQRAEIGTPKGQAQLYARRQAQAARQAKVDAAAVEHDEA